MIDSVLSLRPPDALMQAVFSRCGMGAKSVRLVMFIHEWALCEAALGRKVVVEEYGEWAPGSVRTAYRRLAEFREAFPEFRSPSDLIVWPDGAPTPAAIERAAWTLAAAT